MKKWEKTFLGIVAIVLVISGGVYAGVYWFNIRPSNIRKQCSASSWATIDQTNPYMTQQQFSEYPDAQSTYATDYSTCLSQHGV